MKTLRKVLEVSATIAAIVIVLSCAAALTYVNLRVVFTVDAWATEHNRSAEASEVERARANSVLDRIERHLQQLDSKLGRPVGPRK